MELWRHDGSLLLQNHEALLETADALRSGKIVAVKGIGGFHLMVDARDDRAVKRLRERKHRDEKPFATLFPSDKQVCDECLVSASEQRLLFSPASPIVLLERKEKSRSMIAESVAPNNPWLGVMLPYAPLHHILMRELKFPVVATSGNASDEPMCTDEKDALGRLRGIADLFLVHNRPIACHVDDSVVRVVLEKEQVLRRARGYAPLPVTIDRGLKTPTLAVGGHLKNTVAMSCGQNIFISQHIGDLETPEALQAFREVIRDFQDLYDESPRRIVCDMHPDYLSTKFAKSTEIPLEHVQHHYAHVASCMAENELTGEVLGVSWDGTGYGLDGKIWGGEFLKTTERGFHRVATFHSFRLPGGEKAIKEPRRTGLGALYEVFGPEILRRKDLLTRFGFMEKELGLLGTMLQSGLNSPETTSVGRLFDAVSAILELRQFTSFEGQAAMELEFVIRGHGTDESYGYVINESSPMLIIEWKLMILGILDDQTRGLPASTISAKFHNTLADIVAEVARRIEVPRVVLTGGCFQNKYLTERCVQQLVKSGFRPYWHQRVPPNDGGISLGQMYAVSRTEQQSTEHSTRKEEFTHEFSIG